jgi:hypothetical protein
MPKTTHDDIELSELPVTHNTSRRVQNHGSSVLVTT